jgi:hypothetical protein
MAPLSALFTTLAPLSIHPKGKSLFGARVHARSAHSDGSGRGAVERELRGNFA